MSYIFKLLAATSNLKTNEPWTMVKRRNDWPSPISNENIIKTRVIHSHSHFLEFRKDHVAIQIKYIEFHMKKIHVSWHCSVNSFTPKAFVSLRLRMWPAPPSLRTLNEEEMASRSLRLNAFLSPDIFKILNFQTLVFSKKYYFCVVCFAFKYILSVLLNQRKTCESRFYWF